MTTILRSINHFKQFSFLQVFTIYTRYLIGGAFVVAAFGMGKFDNQELLISSPGTPIENLEPLQQFFRVISTSGLYWNFIGWAQLIAGLLLMTQRFAKLGAAIFFGLILNIFVITLSFDFRGTPIITGLMLLASLFLLLWDFDSFQFAFRKPKPEHLASPELKIHDRAYWSWIGLIMSVSIAAFYFTGLNLLYQLGGCFIIGLLSFFVFFSPLNKSLRQVRV
jgi:hypothetical protein